MVDAGHLSNSSGFSAPGRTKNMRRNLEVLPPSRLLGTTISGWHELSGTCQGLWSAHPESVADGQQQEKQDDHPQDGLCCPDPSKLRNVFPRLARIFKEFVVQVQESVGVAQTQEPRVVTIGKRFA